MDAGLQARTGPDRQGFGPFTLDHRRALLSRDGVPVVLRPKILALLVHLVDRAGQVVGKQELLDAVWTGLVVTDDSLTQAISELRAALGDEGQALIRTVPRRGYRFDAEVRSLADVPVAPGPPPRWFVGGVAVSLGVALVALLLLGLTQLRPAQTPIDAAVGKARSIVVLPFADLSDPPAAHVAHAVGYDLTTDLGRHADVQVILHAAAAAGHDAATLDPRRAAHAVGARHVLAGSVQRQGDAVSVNVRLIRAESGELLWAGRFDYPTVADWAGRREISARVANLLEAKVGAAALAEAVRRTPDGAAVDHWMRGAYLFDRLQARTEQQRSRADLQQARAHFEAALAADPDSVQALAGLSRTHTGEVLFRWSADRKASLAIAAGLARRALAIDPDDLGALKALSGAQMFDGDLEGALDTTRRQLEINPSDAHSVRDYAATLYFLGRWEETLRQLEVAERLNPLDTVHLEKVHSIASNALIALGRYDEAIVHARRMAAVDPQGSRAYVNLASAYAHLGDLESARQAAAELRRRRPDYTIGGSGAAQRGSTAPAYRAGMQHLVDGLRLAGLPERPASAPR